MADNVGGGYENGLNGSFTIDEMSYPVMVEEDCIKRVCCVFCGEARG
jgi:hypothetical protein